MKQLALASIATASICLAPSAALGQATPDGWSFAVTPYLWLPTVNGTLKYEAPSGGSGGPEVGVGPNDYLQNLSAVLMLSGEARNGKWSVFSDLIYLKFSSEESHVKSVDFGGAVVSSSADVSTKSSLKGLQWTLAGAYTTVQSPRVTLDLLGGVRYLGIEARTDWQLTTAVAGPGAGQIFPASGGISKRVNNWDAVIGIRGRARLSESEWFMPYYLDVGTGSSSLTWQGLVGVGYAFKWGDAVLAYRHLYYDQSDDKLFQSFSFSGPTLGASFRF